MHGVCLSVLLTIVEGAHKRLPLLEKFKRFHLYAQFVGRKQLEFISAFEQNTCGFHTNEL